MNNQFRLRNHLLLASLAAAYPVIGYTANAASIEFASGSVVAVTPTGAQRVLSKGSILESGEMIRTGDTGRVQMRFTDGALMSLQPKTEFKVDNYQFDGKADGSEKGFFSLIKGGLRTISGLVGKGNRDNYKITTQVATIGIRGTEYAVAFSGGSDGKLDLATGEGSVQVCNAGGCIIVTSGEAAVVTGANSQPKRTETKPNLPPSTTSDKPATTYTNSEDKTPEGKIAVLLASGGLKSGSGYVAAVAGLHTPPGGSPDYVRDYAGSATATFDVSSQLTSLTGSVGGYDYSASSVSSSFALNGVIGWGVWTSGTYASDHALSQFHYVAGVPTSTSDLTSLGGLTGTYSYAGGTNPTSSLGYVGSNVTGSLTIEFGSGYVNNVNANMSFDMNGSRVAFTASAGEGSGANFQASGSVTSGCSGSCSVNANGFVAGSNAAYAGMAYQITGGGLGTVSGAAAFRQTNLVTTSAGM